MNKFILLAVVVIVLLTGCDYTEGGYRTKAEKDYHNLEIRKLPIRKNTFLIKDVDGNIYYIRAWFKVENEKVLMFKGNKPTK